MYYKQNIATFFYSGMRSRSRNWDSFLEPESAPELSQFCTAPHPFFYYFST